MLYLHADSTSPLTWDIDHWFPCARKKHRNWTNSSQDPLRDHSFVDRAEGNFVVLKFLSHLFIRNDKILSRVSYSKLHEFCGIHQQRHNFTDSQPITQFLGIPGQNLPFLICRLHKPHLWIAAWIIRIWS
jgi:hypothetical protein